MFLTTLFDDPLHYFLVVAVVIASVVLHELGHALAATWEGDPTPRIRGHFTWNPVVHMGWFALGLLAVAGITFGKTPVTPAYFRHRRWGEAIVSAAGPAVNLLLACVAAFVLAGGFRAGLIRGDETDGAFARFWELVLYLNVLLFVFNLIPVPPLDGFGVLEGAVDTGNLGPMLRSLGWLPILFAALIANSPPVRGAMEALMRLLLSGASAVVGAF